MKKLYERYNPKTYTIDIELSLELKSFTTRSSVEVELLEDADTVVLHCKDLAVQNVFVKGEKFNKECEFQLNSDDQTLHIELDETFTKGTSLTVTSEVSAEISKSMHGIYPAHYKEDGEDKVIISTQFESHHAREVFPCIDEPAAKATFDLTVTSKDSHMIVANTPVAEQVRKNGMKTVVFEPTPIMSSYLLAFASGDFVRLTKNTKNGVEVGVLATHEHAEKLDFALDIAVRCQEFYEDYFGIPYPLAKCDHIAIPEFASGAMENWGCITYRESGLVIDEDNTSIVNKQWSASVIAHELAHQWFGNLVTMQWWDDLWLNEGFASWISFLAVDSLFPEWNIWEQFVVDDYSAALSLDALESSHPIRVAINDPREINEIFDSITYRKGSSIIRMLHDYLGHDVFQQGLQQYIANHAYDNATTEDLWSALSKASGSDVGEFMDTWTTKTGYPVVSIELNESEATLTQHRFTLHPDAKPVDYLWQIPLFNDQSDILAGKSMTMPAANLERGINLGRRGVYRTAYPEILMTRFASMVAGGEINPVDRLGLLSDAFDAAEAGSSTVVAALELLKGFRDELDANVLSEISSGLGSLASIMYSSYEGAQNSMASFVHEIIAKPYSSLGWSMNDSDSADTLLARQNIINLAVFYDHKDARQKAESLFKLHQDEEELLHPNLRSIVYSHMAREHGDDKLYQWFETKHNKESLQEEKSRLARALTAFRGEKYGKQNIIMMQSDEVRQQDVISWLAQLLGNRTTRNYTWQWYRENWQWLYGQFKDGHLLNYLALVLAPLTTFEQAKEIRDFFEDKNTTGLDMSLAQSLEKIESAAYWRTRDQSSAQEYFTQ